MEINYCQHCNVPILGKKCDICKSTTLGNLRFHDMGDIRPISKRERSVLLKELRRKEIRDYLHSRLILLARQPGLDYRRDVFVDGFKIGTLEYIKEQHWRYRFIPTGKGAALFRALVGEVDFNIAMKGHIKGKKINEIFEGDWALVSAGNCTAVAVHGDKYSKVKDVFCRKVKPRKKTGIQELVIANKTYIEYLERRAVKYIRSQDSDYVAFSGGKDSEVALYLAYKAGVNNAIYANTGMEFPETERFVYNYADFLGIELIELKPKQDFWSVATEKGIPTKDSRWCTKALKLEGLKRFKGTMVDGSRKYESLARMMRSSERKLGNLRVIYPIRDWLAVDIWTFIYARGLPYNPLYDMGYERIGCYMCPAMLNAEFHHVRDTHPRLYKKWYDYLQSLGYTKEEIIDGVWRWKEVPKKMRSMVQG